ncbi:hypothetical protein TW95_gp1309 [Pandoravirus inopinatum]|uniref:Uncharacterized protein n=1 Tax=Pandoravirus inopinatum TaxID=1605721 RepID=A0A0B5IYS8_9VIRU|nr:hypothetical protein TW95_gp1309 [Pandoravirus inopinatum]AJF98043.1 hypothetical protein [Pandoravirus inopinatum]
MWVSLLASLFGTPLSFWSRWTIIKSGDIAPFSGFLFCKSKLSTQAPIARSNGRSAGCRPVAAVGWPTECVCAALDQIERTGCRRSIDARRSSPTFATPPPFFCWRLFLSGFSIFSF